MDSERWARAESLFHRALALEPDRRGSLLAEACANDPELREAVERLLRADASANTWLDAPERALDPHRADPLVGRRVGAFRLTERIGAGGMGVVYRARRADGLFEQEVAVKLMRAGFATDELLSRFERERRTLAALAHPNIARLYDGGTTDEGAPYLVMELVDGLPIDRYCDEHRLAVDARLRLFAGVCRAVHHAHSALVIHRDLKPANVLVDAHGEPKLLDFGIARLLADDDDDGGERGLERTLTGERVMTPEYASPEQLAGAPVTTATDVYSLGVVLYGLLTGRKPFRVESTSPAAWERVVAERPPTRPSSVVLRSAEAERPLGGGAPDPAEFAARCGTTPARLRHRLAGDLDRIVLMALRKEPERRYASAQELAADLERHLAGRPVLAREASFGYRASKFVRRNRIAVTAAFAVALALVLGIVAAVRGERAAWREALHARIEADSFRDSADFLMTELASTSRSSSSEAVEETLASMERHAGVVRRRYATDRHRQANLIDALGRACMRLADFERARSLFEEAHALRVAEFGPRSLEVALSLGSLGELDYRRGDYAAAVEKLERALELNRDLPEGSHTDVDHAANDLAAALRAAGDLDRAEALHREALELRRQDGEHTLLVAESANNLAGVHLAREEYPAAIESLEEALEIRRTVLGPGDPLTLQTVSNLAYPLWHAGERERARDSFDEAERGYRALHREGEEGLAVVLSGLGSLDYADGRLESARDRFAEALEIRARRLGPDHPELAPLYAKQAELAHALGEDEEARARWDEALRIRRAKLPADHPELARTLRGYGFFLIERGELDEARAELEEAVAILAKRPRDERAELGRAEWGLGRCLRVLGRRDEAREALQDALRALDGAPGSGSDELERVRRELEALE